MAMRSTPVRRSISALFVLAIALCIGNAASAQSLNWEGQTGALITPFAYTAKSPAKGFGRPAVAFHYLSGGAYLNDAYQISVTVGFLGRAEAGYTRTLVSDVNDETLNHLFDQGFNTFHAKVNVIPENMRKTTWVPAISVGFVARTNENRGALALVNLGTIPNPKNTTETYDVYLVGTKTISQIPHVPILLSAGVKGTNASILGIVGAAPDWEARGFGAVGFVFTPAKQTLILGAEVLQEPNQIAPKTGDAAIAGISIPTTLTYFARFVPNGVPLNFDLAVAQIAGCIAGPCTNGGGINLHARSRIGIGISYRF
jgi:hypothetical protein